MARIAAAPSADTASVGAAAAAPLVTAGGAAAWVEFACWREFHVSVLYNARNSNVSKCNYSQLPQIMFQNIWTLWCVSSTEMFTKKKAHNLLRHDGVQHMGGVPSSILRSGHVPKTA